MHRRLTFDRACAGTHGDLGLNIRMPNTSLYPPLPMWYPCVTFTSQSFPSQHIKFGHHRPASKTPFEHHRPASETPFEWRFADGSKVTHFLCLLGCSILPQPQIVMRTILLNMVHFNVPISSSKRKFEHDLFLLLYIQRRRHIHFLVAKFSF